MDIKFSKVEEKLVEKTIITKRIVKVKPETRYTGKTHTIMNLRIQEQLLADFKKAAADNNVSMSFILKQCMEQFIDKYGKKEETTVVEASAEEVQDGQ